MRQITVGVDSYHGATENKSLVRNGTSQSRGPFREELALEEASSLQG